MSSDELTLTCEAASNPPSTVCWTAQISGNRERLDNTSSDYSITSSMNLEAMPPVTIGELEYEPSEVDFTNPECIIENPFDSVRVRNPSFVEDNNSTTVNGEESFLMQLYSLNNLPIAYLFTCQSVYVTVRLSSLCNCFHRTDRVTEC